MSFSASAKRLFAIGFLMAAGLTARGGGALPPTNAAHPKAGEWPSYGRDYREQRFSPLEEITTENVSELRLAWFYDFRVGRGVFGTPLMVDGILYATSAWSIVYALDAKTGKELWVFDPKADGVQASKSCCDVVNRGVAYLDGRVFDGVIDGRLIALDAKTGHLLWQTQTVDTSWPYTITGAPRAAKGMVFIGNSGSDLGVRGYASAYDARTGKLVWRFYTVPGDPSKGADGAASDSVMPMAAKTWNGKWWIQGGGGAVWDSITYDPELDRVYFGTGNGSPWNRQWRSPGGGDNLFIASIIAVDRATGRYVWHYQCVPGDTWDSDATESLILATLKIDGKDRRVLMQAPKNGFYYVIDRETGKLISAKNIVPMAKAEDTPPGQPISWAYGIDLKTGRPYENPGVRFENGSTSVVSAVGVRQWAPMAFNPVNGLAYLTVGDGGRAFKTDPNYEPKPFLRASGFAQVGFPAVGPPAAQNSGPRPAPPASRGAPGGLMAWNPVTQQEVWRVPYHSSAWGGVLTTAGSLVFEATGAPELNAFDALTGKKLWSFPIQASAQGGPISYEIDGEQYIAIETGNGGDAYLLGGPDKPAPNKGRVLVFKLGATAALPTLPESVPPFPPPPVINAGNEMLQRGGQLYNGYCGACHGFGAMSTRVLPDLRRSAMIQSADALQSIVLKGELAQEGMPNLGSALSPEDLEAIRAYIASRAAEAYRVQESHHSPDK
jgi:quinohemoprotein ethanol dehydrogenase